MRKTLTFLLTLGLLFTYLSPALLSAAPVWDDDTGILDIAAGYSHALVLKEDGTVWSWGGNERGQVGIGTQGSYSTTEKDLIDSNPQYTPAYVMSDAIKIAAGDSHSLVVAKDGSLWSFGSGSSAQLGNGKRDTKRHTSIPTSQMTPDMTGTITYIVTDLGFNVVNVPTKVIDSGVKDIAAGAIHSLVLKTDSSLWGFGSNSSGQLGVPDAPSIDQFIETVGEPVKIMDGVITMAAGDSASYAIKNDNSLWAWGDNYYGQLGDGSTTNHPTPVKIMDGAAKIFAGGNSAMVIKTDGSLWAFGYNGYSRGFLGTGDGSNGDVLIPEKIADDAIYANIGSLESYYITSAHELHGCGYVRTNGPLLKHEKLTDGIALIQTSASMSLLVKTDGSVCTWGNSNEHGQLGTERSLAERYDANYPATAAAIRGPIGSSAVTEQNTVPSLSESNPAINQPDTAQPAPQTNATALVATPTAAKIILDQHDLEQMNLAFEAYNINGSNYFKLREIAHSVNMTPKQFSVSWDSERNAISLKRGELYTATGDELLNLNAAQGKAKDALPTSSKLLIDGEEHSFVAYNIDGSNYFKLRDVAEAFDFHVGWDAEKNAITIVTSASYGD